MTMDFEEKAIIYALPLSFRKEKKKQRRKMQVRPLISQRLLKGQFHKLSDDLCAYPKQNIDYFRMNKKSFDELLPMIQPCITYRNTNMRMTIGPEERIAVTLR